MIYYGLDCGYLRCVCFGLPVWLVVWLFLVVWLLLCCFGLEFVFGGFVYLACFALFCLRFVDCLAMDLLVCWVILGVVIV